MPGWPGLGTSVRSERIVECGVMLDHGKDHLLSAPTEFPSSLKPSLTLIGPEKLKQLYAGMLKVRLLQERFHPRKAARSRIAWQEACTVGCTMDLRSRDAVAASSHQYFVGLTRELPAFISKASVGEQESTPQIEKALLLSLENQSSGERTIFATGVAAGYQVQKKDSVVMAFSEAEGLRAAREILRLAFEDKLPIVYVQQGPSNQSSRRRKDSRQLPMIPVDQSDVVAIYRVACEAIDKARRGVGPTIIQCVEHLPLKRFRDGALHADPIERMEWQLRKKGLWSDEFKQSTERCLLEELKANFPTPKLRRSNGERTSNRVTARHPHRVSDQ